MNLFRSIKLNILFLFRDLQALFWNTFFPIILATFFTLVFSQFSTSEFKKIDIAIKQDSQLSQTFKELPYFNIKEAGDDIAKDLKEKKYKAYIDDDLSISVNSSDSEVMVVKNVLDLMKQVSETNLDKQEIIKNIQKNYIEENNQKSVTSETILLSILI